ncbi:amino acid-binding protein [Microbacterium gallinarum]|uniref:Amino acid-binding protein n=1 Tax=Microbacterium gallinarum TaxID=2762209 RepID=A0ABR8X4V3_9MICO|nr:amino acid-binding protein [Microbacterium gallinarum]MBD8024364.1 amino acid-binding protein [Microbacterium gallinarum]
MNDISIPVRDIASDVARIGRVLGSADVGLEGGGVWGDAAHYLVEDGEAALRALTTAGILGAESRGVVLAALPADRPGALGRMMTALATARIRIHAQYSDHDNRKVFVVDDIEGARRALA